MLVTVEGGRNQTPKPGYKSITLKNEIYDHFYNEWLGVKEECTTKKGIRSFSAYITYRLTQLMNQDLERRRKEQA